MILTELIIKILGPLINKPILVPIKVKDNKKGRAQ